MPDYTLTTAFPVPNPNRIEVAQFDEIRTVRNDPNSVTELKITLEFRSPTPTDREYGSYVIFVRNGTSSQLRVRASYPAGMVLQDMLEVSDAPAPGGVDTPTGMTTVLAAWRSGSATGSGAGNRRKAVMQALKDLGIVYQSGALAGVVP
jgi:hypothetical protein